MAYCVRCGEITDNQHLPTCPYGSTSSTRRRGAARRWPGSSAALKPILVGAVGVVLVTGAVLVAVSQGSRLGVLRSVASPTTSLTVQATTRSIAPSTTASRQVTVPVAVTPVTTRVATPATASPTTSRPCPADKQPANGINIEKQADTSGLGELVIDNGSDKAAQVKMVAVAKGGQTMRHFFVAAQSEWTATGIPDGAYRVLVLQGRGWSADEVTFGCDRSAREFEKHLVFTTTSTSSTGWTLTLHTVVGGGARTTGISPATFFGTGS